MLLTSTHDVSWSLGPFGEVFGTYNFVFLGSSMPFESAPPMEEETPQPLPNEASVSIDWTLPMTESAQALLFKRVLSHWNRTTSSFPVNMKKKYRLSADELQKTRNTVVLFDQLLPHLQVRMTPENVKSWQEDIAANSKRDADLQFLFNTRPSRFSLSMFPSEQEVAKKDLWDMEQKKVEAKEEQQAEVDAAQWNFFKGALKRDHDKVEQAQDAPRLVKRKLHSKQVSHRSKLAAEGDAACKGYQDWHAQKTCVCVFCLFAGKRKGGFGFVSLK